MATLRWSALGIRGQGATLAALALVHAVLVGWVAWYIAEAAWGSAPLSASPTPLPAAAFAGAWMAGAALLAAAGPGVGAGAMRGRWVGPDPTVALPVGAAARAGSAWIAAAATLAVVGLAPAPLYVALHAMGSFALEDAVRPLLVQAGAIALAPLAGIGIVAARRRRSAVPW